MKYKALTTLDDEDARSTFLLEAFAPEKATILKQRALDLMGITRAGGNT